MIAPNIQGGVIIGGRKAQWPSLYQQSSITAIRI